MMSSDLDGEVMHDTALIYINNLLKLTRARARSNNLGMDVAYFGKNSEYLGFFSKREK